MCPKAVHQYQGPASRLHGSNVSGSQATIDFAPAESGYSAGVRDCSRDGFPIAGAALQCAVFDVSGRSICVDPLVSHAIGWRVGRPSGTTGVVSLPHLKITNEGDSAVRTGAGAAVPQRWQAVDPIPTEV
jgi:hypothetical protein